MMNLPKSIHDVQRLTGWVAILHIFIFKSADKCLPLFKILRESKAFEWTDELEVVIEQLKKYLGSPLLKVTSGGEDLLLYLSILPISLSTMLIKDKDKIQRPVYYISKILLRAKTRYSRKLCHYFQAHQIIVLMDQPLKHILQRPNISGRLLKCSIEFHIKYRPRMTIKA